MDDRQKLAFYKEMKTIRMFEQEIKRLYHEGLVEGAIHCYTGQEAIAVGVCVHLSDRDYIFSTHRGHGHSIAKGCDLESLFAELMGKRTGVSCGMGGSMHLFDVQKGLMGGNGIVGAGLPLSLGTAYAAKYKKTDRVTVCFFSDGASNQGTFHESLNMASLWKLPVVFVCENNLFAATTPSYKTLSHPDIAKRAKGYAINGVIADGNDVFDVYEKSRLAVEHARKGEGPTLIECKTYRVEGHCMVLKDLPEHRPKDDVQKWLKKDPIDRCEKRLIREGLLDEHGKTRILQQIEKKFDKAIEAAKKAPVPNVDEYMKKASMRYDWYPEWSAVNRGGVS